MGSLYEIILVYQDLHEIQFIMIGFTVFFSSIGFDESDNLCWKHDIFLRELGNKITYICHYMSAY